MAGYAVLHLRCLLDHEVAIAQHAAPVPNLSRCHMALGKEIAAQAIRTAEWTYCIANPFGGEVPAASSYSEYVMFNNAADQGQVVSLAGRDEFKEVSAQLRKELLALIEESGDPIPEIIPAHLWYP